MKSLAGSIFFLLIFILQFAFACVCVWLAFWIVNGVMWLSGIGGEALITEVILRDLNPWGRALVYILEFEWLYALAFFLILHELYNHEDGIVEIEKVAGILLAILAIFVYDPRIAPHMPGFIEGPIQWLQTTCNARLVGGISMLHTDLSGDISDPVYYKLFDFLIGGAAVFWLIYKNWLKED